MVQSGNTLKNPQKKFFLPRKHRGCQRQTAVIFPPSCIITFQIYSLKGTFLSLRFLFIDLSAEEIDEEKTFLPFMELPDHILNFQIHEKGNQGRRRIQTERKEAEEKSSIFDYSKSEERKRTRGFRYGEKSLFDYFSIWQVNRRQSKTYPECCAILFQKQTYSFS